MRFLGSVAFLGLFASFFYSSVELFAQNTPLVEFHYQSRFGDGWSERSFEGKLSIDEEAGIVREIKEMNLAERSVIHRSRSDFKWVDNEEYSFDRFRSLLARIADLASMDRAVSLAGRPVLRAGDGREISVVIHQNGRAQRVYLVRPNLEESREIVDLVPGVDLDELLHFIESFFPSSFQLPRPYTGENFLELRADDLFGLVTQHPEVIVLDADNPRAHWEDSQTEPFMVVPYLREENVILVRTASTPRRVVLSNPERNRGTNLLFEFPFHRAVQTFYLTGVVRPDEVRTIASYSSGARPILSELGPSHLQDWSRDFSRFPCIRLLGYASSR